MKKNACEKEEEREERVERVEREKGAVRERERDKI